MSNINGEFKGSTLARLTNIECRLAELQSESKEQSLKLDAISRKVTYIYGFAGGLGVLAGLISSFVFDKLFK